MASAEGDHRFPSKHESGQDRLRLFRPSCRILALISAWIGDLRWLYHSPFLPIRVCTEHPEIRRRSRPHPPLGRQINGSLHARLVPSPSPNPCGPFLMMQTLTGDQLFHRITPPRPRLSFRFG